ncbi:hypothetical protein [Methylothermus subterraneus]
MEKYKEVLLRGAGILIPFRGWDESAYLPWHSCTYRRITFAEMKRVRILSLKGISRRLQAIIRDGQMESARVWNLCRDRHLAARRKNQPWPGKNEFHEATKGGKFALHSQSVQQVFRAFDAAVQSAREHRKSGRRETLSLQGQTILPADVASAGHASESKAHRTSDGARASLFGASSSGVARPA